MYHAMYRISLKPIGNSFQWLGGEDNDKMTIRIGKGKGDMKSAVPMTSELVIES
jgi:hypothetical protein